MPLLTIVKYPDPRLWQKAEAIDDFGADLKTFASDLLQTMRAAPGVGITACHAGVLKRLVIIELEKNNSQIYVNPQVTWSSDNLSEATEGSVSMPGVVDIIRRPARVHVSYQDISGKVHETEADDFLATCLQHEIDQLDGIFWLDRLSRLKRERLIKKYQKLLKSSP